MNYSQEEIGDVAKMLLQTLQEKNMNILALSGDLGAGKTTLVSTIAQELGVKENVLSPTFIVYRTYEIADSRCQIADCKTKLPWKRLVHIDAYRLEGEDDARRLRLDELFAAKENLVCIEWPENIGTSVPENVLNIQLRHISETMREISICRAL